MKSSTKRFNKRVKVQEGLTAQNALDAALRLTDYDVWQQKSQSIGNALTNIKIDLLSLQPQVVAYLYKTFGILGKVVDIPVEDAYRYGGFELLAETIDDSEKKKLSSALVRKGDIAALKKARKWARLFGGAAIILLDGRDLSTPVRMETLYNRPLSFVAVDRWQLTYDQPHVGMTGGHWQLANSERFQQQSGTCVHPSRVMIVHGKDAPFIIEQQVQGWGISVYEQIFQDMSQFFKSRNVLFELLDEAKIDILKLNSLQTALSTAQGERGLQRMVDLIARNKNYKGQVTLSTQDEYDQKQMSFSGIEGILKEIRVMMSGSANMPVNKLWGEGVTGFGSGEDSLENYNAQIESEIRTPDTGVIDWLLRCRCYQLFGREVEDLEIEWKPLRILSSVDEQTIHTSKIDNLLKLYAQQLLTPQELMEIMKEQGLLSYDTKAIRGELEDMPMLNMDNNNDNDQRSED